MVIYYPASGAPVGDQARLHLSVASGLPDVVQQMDALVESFLRPMLGFLHGLQVRLSEYRAMLVGAEPQLLLPCLVHPGALPQWLLGASSYLAVQDVAR